MPHAKLTFSLDSHTRKSPPIRVVIFGNWSRDWMDALGARSDLWKNHPFVREVLVVGDTEIPEIPPSSNSGYITIVLPLMEQHIAQCPKNYLSLIPDIHTLKTLAIKNDFDDYMHRIGLSHLIPARYKDIDDISYPAVLKRVDLNAGNGIVVINSIKNLMLCVQHATWQKRQIILQEYVPGHKEYVTHLVCKNGDILWHSSFSFELMPGMLIKATSNIKKIERIELSTQILQQFKECLKPLNFNGPCNIDFKLTSQGNLKIFEINPRFGGSLMRKENIDLLKEMINSVLLSAINIKQWQ